VSAQEQPQPQQQSLYRRHRPRTFDEVVGQEPVVRTLRHAVERGKVHHAYLFVGSRGTGKTSMAKILAACLNCERGPTTDPCGECESCLSIARASSLDVIEMDAASNNSVDDIRELRESVAYAPVSGRRKVYILDEAHMLSTAAWNAFLKTLEEPPPNTVFVLATTEAQKVPATVIDRCHRFDFHRPTVEQIASVVRRSAQAESIEIPPAAVSALARSATGSFRDALGTLEQIVTYGGNQIALEDVLAVLGVADAGLLEETVDAVAAGDGARALRALAQCAEQGRDAGSFAVDLEVRARELLVVQTLAEVPAELSLTEEADAALQAQAERVEQSVVVRLLEALGAAMEGARAGADPRTRLELALVKAAKPEVDSSVRALLERLERLEHDRGLVSAVASERELSSAETRGPRSGTQPPSGKRASSPAPVPTPESPAGEAAVRGEGPPSTASALGERASAAETASAAESVPTAETAPTTETALAESAPAAESAPPVESAPAADGAAAAEAPATDDAAAIAQPAAPGEPLTAAAATVVARDLDSLCSIWPAVVDLVRSGNALLGALIEEARPVAVDGEELTVAFAATAPFLKKKAEDPDNRAIVTSALRDITGGRWRLLYELRGELDAPAPAEGGHTEQEWLARFMKEFDAEELPGDWLPEQHDSSTESDARAHEQSRAQVVASEEKGA
jgi:DNA polymerase-3 subunit gamma/tau